jgi:lactam utilization protein B
MYERAMRDNEIVAVLLEGIKQLDNLLVVYGKRMAAEAEQS